MIRYIQIFFIIFSYLLVSQFKLNAQNINTSKSNFVDLKSIKPNNVNIDDPIVTKIIFGAGGPFEHLQPQDEDISLRTATSKHFKLSDGTMQALVGAGPVHYSENGKWKTILANILPNSTNLHTDYYFAAPHNNQKIYFPQHPTQPVLTNMYGKEYSDWGKPSLVWLDKNGKEISTISVNTNSIGIASELELSYTDIFPNVDAKIINSTTTKELKYILKNSAILNNRPNNAVYLAFRENIKHDDNWELNVVDSKANNAGVVLNNQVESYFFSENGKKIVELQKPFYHDFVSTGYCTDAGFDNSKTNDDEYLNGSYLIKNKKKHSFTAYVLVPISWLINPNRKFPITIDPTTDYYPGGGPYSITFPTAKNGSTWYCQSGTYLGRTYDYDISYGWTDESSIFGNGNSYLYSYATFDITAIPDNAVIQDATSNWYRYGGRTCADAITLKH